MNNFKNFRKFICKNRANITVKGTPAQWPYNYGTNIAYLVTFQGLTKYFYFNSDGIILATKTI
jgi:hypothetical protein